MTCSTHFANNMIVYLLVGFLLQLDGTHAAPGEHTLCKRADDGSTTVTATDAAKTATAIADDAVSTATDTSESLLKSAGSTAMDFGSEASKSVEEIIKAGGRVSLAVGNLCSQLFNTISLTLATGSGYLASGVGTVDGLLNSVPIVGVITSGVNKFATGLSSTVGEMSATGRQSRTKMFNQLREQLNQSVGSATDTTTNAASTAAAATDSTSASS